MPSISQVPVNANKAHPIPSPAYHPAGGPRPATPAVQFSLTGQQIDHRKIAIHADSTHTALISNIEMPDFFDARDDLDRECPLSIAIRQSVEPPKQSDRLDAKELLTDFYIPELEKIKERINHDSSLLLITSEWANSHDKYGLTPLKEAARNGVMLSIKPLVAIGATPLQEGFATSLHEALRPIETKIYMGVTRYQVMEELLKAIKTSHPDTLYQAVNKKPSLPADTSRFSSSIDLLSRELVISKNTVLNQVLYDDKIRFKETVELVKLLLSYEADPLIRNSDNQNAFSILYSYENLDRELLEPMIDAVPLENLDQILKSPCTIPPEFIGYIQNIISKRKEKAGYSTETASPLQSPLIAFSDLDSSTSVSDLSESSEFIEQPDGMPDKNNHYKYPHFSPISENSCDGEELTPHTTISKSQWQDLSDTLTDSKNSSAGKRK